MSVGPRGIHRCPKGLSGSPPGRDRGPSAVPHPWGPGKSVLGACRKIGSVTPAPTPSKLTGLEMAIACTCMFLARTPGLHIHICMIMDSRNLHLPNDDHIATLQRLGFKIETLGKVSSLINFPIFADILDIVKLLRLCKKNISLQCIRDHAFHSNVRFECSLCAACKFHAQYLAIQNTCFYPLGFSKTQSVFPVEVLG